MISLAESGGDGALGVGRISCQNSRRRFVFRGPASTITAAFANSIKARLASSHVKDLLHRCMSKIPPNLSLSIE
jgi:hypothetical protein